MNILDHPIRHEPGVPPGTCATTTPGLCPREAFGIGRISGFPGLTDADLDDVALHVVKLWNANLEKRKADERHFGWTGE